MKVKFSLELLPVTRYIHLLIDMVSGCSGVSGNPRAKVTKASKALGLRTSTDMSKAHHIAGSVSRDSGHPGEVGKGRPCSIKQCSPSR